MMRSDGENSRPVALVTVATLLTAFTCLSYSHAGDKAVLLPLLSQRWCPASPLIEYKTIILDPSWRQTPITDPAPIADLPVVKLNITVTDTDCPDECRSRVSETLAQTLNLWRQICIRCKEGTMAFLVDENLIYVDTRVSRALRQATDLFSDKVKSVSEVLFALSQAGDTQTGHVLATYDMVSSDASEIRQFCENDTATYRGSWINELSTALCGAADAHESAPSMNVEFIRGTVCENPNFVACGEPDNKISIDLRGISYVGEGGANDHIIGDRDGVPYSLVSILLHEGGHFLGLPHLPHEDLRTNLSTAMLEQVNYNTCVSITEAMMLNSAADRGWLYRAEKCGGLMRPGKIAK